MRFLLSGYYGFGNLGDEALLEVIVSRLKAHHPNAQIDVLSADPKATACNLAVESTPRWEAKAVRKAIANSDAVLSGGGGLLQNATSLRSLVYYAGIIRTAVRLERTTMIFAQSIGPLDFWGKAVVREICKGLAGATVRDARSQGLLASLAPSLRIEVTADPAFLYEPPAENIDLTAEGLGRQSDPLVVVCIRKAPGMKDRIGTLASAVDRLTTHHGARVAFLPLGGAPDADISSQVIRKCASAPMLLPATSAAKAAGIIRSAKAVIGMRLHALIFATRSGVPFLPIPYDPKVAALCEDLQYPCAPFFSLAPPSPKLSPAQAEAAIDRFWNSRTELGAHLRGMCASLERRAERNFGFLDEILTEKR